MKTDVQRQKCSKWVMCKCAIVVVIGVNLTLSVFDNIECIFDTSMPWLVVFMIVTSAMVLFFAEIKNIQW